MSASSDRLWMVEWQCSGGNKAVSLASLLSVIDHERISNFPLWKPAFFYSVSFHPFLAFPSHNILASDLRNTLGGWGRRSDLLPSSAHCWIPADAHPNSWCTLQAGWRLEFKVLLQLLLFFKCKLGYWVRAKSTCRRAEGSGVGIDKWHPHLTSKPKCA